MFVILWSISAKYVCNVHGLLVLRWMVCRKLCSKFVLFLSLDEYVLHVVSLCFCATVAESHELCQYYFWLAVTFYLKCTNCVLLWASLELNYWLYGIAIFHEDKQLLQSRTCSFATNLDLCTHCLNYFWC